MRAVIKDIQSVALIEFEHIVVLSSGEVIQGDSVQIVDVSDSALLQTEETGQVEQTVVQVGKPDHKPKQECIPGGCVLTAAVAATRCQYWWGV